MSKTRSYFTSIVPLFGIAFPTCISCPILHLLPPKSTLAFSPPPSTHFLPLMPISYPQSLLHRRHAKSALCVSASLNAAPAYKWTSDAIYAETLSPVPVWRNIFFFFTRGHCNAHYWAMNNSSSQLSPFPLFSNTNWWIFLPPLSLVFCEVFHFVPKSKVGAKRNLCASEK